MTYLADDGDVCKVLEASEKYLTSREVGTETFVYTHMGTPITGLYCLDCFDLVLHWYLLVWHWYLLHIL